MPLFKIFKSFLFLFILEIISFLDMGSCAEKGLQTCGTVSMMLPSIEDSRKFITSKVKEDLNPKQSEKVLVLEEQKNPNASKTKISLFKYKGIEWTFSDYNCLNLENVVDEIRYSSIILFPGHNIRIFLAINYKGFEILLGDLMLNLGNYTDCCLSIPSNGGLNTRWSSQEHKDQELPSLIYTPTGKTYP